MATKNQSPLEADFAEHERADWRGPCCGVCAGCPSCLAAFQAGRECFDAALDYLKRGWAPSACCPPDHARVGDAHEKSCNSPGKAPWGTWKQFQDRPPTEQELRKKWNDNKFLNVGIFLGPVSGLVRIDIDGAAGEAMLAELSGGELPATLEFSSGGGGRGLLFGIPAGVTIKTTPIKGDAGRLHQEVRFQAKGAQTVMPPSRHVSGRRYLWKPGRGPDQIDAALLPPALVELMRVKPPQASSSTHTNGSTFKMRATNGPDVMSRARAYLKTCPAAVQGSNGSGQLMKTLRLVIDGFALDDQQASEIAFEYSASCLPPWSEKEIEHALDSIKATPPEQARGWLLHENNSQSANDDGLRYVVNYRSETIDGETIRIGLSQQSIHTQVNLVVGEWPKSACNMLFVEGDNYQPRFLDSSPKLFAWIGSQMSGGEDNHIFWQDRGSSMVSRAQFFEYLRLAAEQYEGVEGSPHFPPMPGHYYLHPPIQSGDGIHLRKFLDFFNPLTSVDRDLMLGLLASLAWGGPCGSRPAWMVTGPPQDPHGGRGVGKTTFVEKCAELTGGVISVNDPAGAKAEEIERRLLSPEGRKIRTLLIDNLKALKFSWAYLEAIITSKVISGRQMYLGEGRRANNLTIVITANGATLSRDMAQRCNVLKLDRPKYSAGSWDKEITEFIEKHRWEILGDLKSFFDAPAKTIASPSRWGRWQEAVLARLDEPSDVQRTLEERSADCDEDQEESDIVRAEIRAEIRSQFHDPDAVRVKFSARALAELVNRATNEKRATGKATAYLRQLQIPEMQGRTNRGGRFYFWIGQHADPNKTDLIITQIKSEPGKWDEVDG
jgi:hypothetical protein